MWIGHVRDLGYVRASCLSWAFGWAPLLSKRTAARARPHTTEPCAWISGPSLTTLREHHPRALKWSTFVSEAAPRKRTVARARPHTTEPCAWMVFLWSHAASSCEPPLSKNHWPHCVAKPGAMENRKTLIQEIHTFYSTMVKKTSMQHLWADFLETRPPKISSSFVYPMVE